MPTNEMNCFITPREAAAILSLSPGTLANWRMDRKYLRYFRFGSRIRYRVADINAFARRTMRTSVPEDECNVANFIGSARRFKALD